MAALWMLFASFAFAAMGAAVKLASSLYSTSELLMYRGLIGAVILLVFIRQQGATLKTDYGRAHLWRSCVGVTSLWLWFFAIGRLPLATAMTLNYMAPIWIAAWVFFSGWLVRSRKSGRTHPGPRQTDWPLIGAIIMSFIGVTLALQPAVESKQWLGGLAGVCSSVISAMAYLQVRKLGQLGEPEYRVVFYFSLTTAVTGLSMTLAGDGPQGAVFNSHTPYGLFLLACVGCAALAAQMAMTRAYRVGKVLVVANLHYTGIVFSGLWGLALWGDRFDWHVWLGMAVILVSGMAATFYNTGKAARTKAP